MSPKQYDVAILGSGLASSILAAILARHGHSVLLLEAGSHPRFAIGESVVPEFGALANLLADLYDVPELAQLTNFQRVRHGVSANCGIKRNFSFLQHADGAEPHREDWSQFQTMTHPLGPDSHLYRPDIDAWLTVIAVKYGAYYIERAPIRGPEDIDVGDDGVRVTSGGKSFEARFLVDGTGFRSVLAEKLELRKEPDFATDSRSIFTHMVGVGRLADALPKGQRPPVPSSPDQGTLHHHFDGGWFWVIPFDNHAQSVNPVCSVGLTLDRTRHPDNDLDAETEFRSFVARFPAVARQFEHARAVRSWVKSGRIQYQSSRVTGPRWCLLPHSAGFLDPLFSGGLVLTLLGVRQIASALLEALPADDPEPRGLQAYEEQSQANARALDRVVHGAYIAFRSPGLFNAWYRFWAVGNYHGSAGTIALNMKFLETGDRAIFECLDSAPYRQSLASDNEHVRSMVKAGYAVLQSVDRGELAPDEAKAQLLQILDAQKEWIPPQFHIADPTRRYLASFTVFPLLAMIFWGKRNTSSEFKETYYSVGPIFFLELTKSLYREAKRSTLSFLDVAKAAHWTSGRS